MVEAHGELLKLFLENRREIVAKLEGVLNAQRKPAEFLRDRSLLFRLIEDCFYGVIGIDRDQAGLRGRLQAAQLASGFKPRHMPELFNDVINPAELTIRAFFFWDQTRWPGRNARMRYAQTVFNLYVVRILVLASLRIWDAAPNRAGARLEMLQAVLDGLWLTSPADQPVLVRDARWLIPLGQSPTTDELAAYFDVAEHVAETLGEADRAEIQKAHVRMIGGHLTSQIRHYCLRDRLTLNDKTVVLRTRMSNALDFALLVQNLVPLLEAYERASQQGDSATRLDMAGAILQAISPDPELFLNRIDLLGPHSMIEHLFVMKNGDDQVAYTPMGRRHVEYLQRYEQLVARLLGPLRDDSQNFKPVVGGYSPFGAIFGTPTNLVEDMSLKAVQRDAVTQFGLEDVFTDGGEEKLAWVNGWRDLPHVDREVIKQYEYPQLFAEEIYDRIVEAFEAAGPDEVARRYPKAGRLFLLSNESLEADSKPSQTADLPLHYLGSSDQQLVDDGKAVSYDPARILRDRQEGYFVLSFETPGGWLAIKKDFLTEVLGEGLDARIVGLPAEAGAKLELTCPGLVHPIGR